MLRTITVKYKKYRKKIPALLALVAVAVFFLLYYYKITVPFVKELSEETVKSEAMDTIHAANKKVQALEAFYGSLFEFIKNEEGEIVLIKSNSGLINQISMLATAEIQNSLNLLRKKTINIPMGAFTGSALVSDRGRNVPLKIISIGKCDSVFLSKFYATGINHTLHRVLIDVEIDIDILVPWHTQTVNVAYQILIAENVIVGKVPTTYLASGSGFDADYLDLIP